MPCGAAVVALNLDFLTWKLVQLTKMTSGVLITIVAGRGEPIVPVATGIGKMQDALTAQRIIVTSAERRMSHQTPYTPSGALDAGFVRKYAHHAARVYTILSTVRMGKVEISAKLDCFNISIESD